MANMRIICAVLCFVVLVKAHNIKPNAANSGSSLNAFSKFYKNCENDEDVFRCIKQQALKLVQRAMNLQSIKVVDGLTLTQRDQSSNAERKSMENDLQSDAEVRSLSGDQLDSSLWNGVGKLMSNFQLQLNLPKVIDYAQNEVVEVEEGRKKRKKYLGPFLAAMAIKAGILKLAYHSIAIVAAKALSKCEHQVKHKGDTIFCVFSSDKWTFFSSSILNTVIGKIALVISAIIGLKKLVAPEGHEKTTYEIVKHPHVQQSHSYSSSHGEYDNHDGEFNLNTKTQKTPKIINR